MGSSAAVPRSFSQHGDPLKNKPDPALEEALRRLKESGIPSEIRRLRAEAPCPPPEVLDAYLRGGLPEAEAEDIAVHLLGCPMCAADILARDQVDREAEAAFEASGQAARGFRRRAFLARAAAAVLVAGALLWLLLPGPDLISEAFLRGDRGLVRGGSSAFVPGERFRLELRSSGPASILALLEDPRGGLSEVYPAAGDSTLLDGPAALALPGKDEAWDTGGLDRGVHALWIFAEGKPFPPADRARVRDLLGRLARGSAPRLDGRADLADLVRRQSGCKAVLELPFRVE
jgi:hypothetical protein